ncbi:hypothetical protein, partial [Streptomyces mordarskii]|uniref:hypothetical protein n=1 Tax=Streptomyces mordarskii TaxID=1226758 RepID=UPI0031F8D9B1
MSATGGHPTPKARPQTHTRHVVNSRDSGNPESLKGFQIAPPEFSDKRIHPVNNKPRKGFIPNHPEFPDRGIPSEFRRKAEFNRGIYAPPPP